VTRNVFLKSILRQKASTLLLFILISLISFGFVLRTVEFVVVRAQIHAIASSYRSIGFFYGHELFGNVSEAVPFLEENPYIAFVDNRRDMLAYLQDFNNADFRGTPPGQPRAQQIRLNDAVFFGYMVEVVRSNTNIHIIFEVCEVLVGYYEHVTVGQIITLSMPVRHHDRFVDIEDMVAGGRYLARGIFHAFVPEDDASTRLPVAGRDQFMTLTPLNLENQGDIFIAPAPAGEYFDFDAHGLAHLPQAIREINYNQRSLTLTATADMSALPMLQGNPVITVYRGRMIIPEDSEQGRQVVVISDLFAQRRGLDIGDTIAMSIPEIQYYNTFFRTAMEVGSVGGNFIDIDLVGDINAPRNEIELEIVGIFRLSARGQFIRERLTQNVFVPVSLVPDNFEILPPINPASPMLGWDYGHIPDRWVSFILEDSRYEQAFYLAHNELFDELGLEVVIIGADSLNFWASASSILTIITFNAVVFWVVLLLVMTLVVFLNLRSRLRIFSISRALGVPKVRIIGNLLISVIILGLPAIIVGGGMAWFLGMEQAAATLGPLVYIVDGFDVVTGLAWGWFALFSAVIAGYMLLTTFMGGAFILSRPVLELLQGNLMPARKKKEKIAENDGSTHAFATSMGKFSLPEEGLFKSSRMARMNMRTLIRRLIVRTPVKSTLGVAVALFFIIALGWLQEAVVRAQIEIDRLYDTTVVYADIRPAVLAGGVIERMGVARLLPGHHVGGFIAAWTVNHIDALPYRGELYTEVGHIRAFLINPDSEGNTPDNWRDLIGFQNNLPSTHPQNLSVLNFIYAFSDFDVLMSEHTRGFDDRFADDLEITFVEGFGADDLVMNGTSNDFIVPVIVYQGTLDDRALTSGSVVSMGYSRGSTLANDETIHSVPVRIIGTHNGHIHRENLGEAVLMPLAYKAVFMDEMMSHIMIRFDIDTAHNREIVTIREELERITIGTPARPGGFVSLTLMLLDEELRNVAIAMEQTLLLLALLYPIAVTFAVIIGAGLSMLLVMQNIKNAAVMRVLGATRRHAARVLCCEQMTVVLGGAIIGFIFLLSADWGFGLAAILGLVGMYLAGAAMGAIVGGIIVTSKPPLELLQVRE